MELVVCLRCAHLFNRCLRRFAARLRRLVREHPALLRALPASTHVRWPSRLVETHRLDGATVARTGLGARSLPVDVVRRRRGRERSASIRATTPTASARRRTRRFPSRLRCFRSMARFLWRWRSRSTFWSTSNRRSTRSTALGAAVAASGGVVYTEVPNGDLMLRDCALWDLIYEHRSYFVEHSLRVACRARRVAHRPDRHVVR